ncbi:MAG: hypothetical protein HOP29_08290 [Phycisphaerales bacterium]|nr:hypothetical protein [Phycisphaerales bacterium]
MAAVLVLTGDAFGGALTVVSIEPGRHELNVPVKSSITIDFDQPVMTSSVNVNSFRAYGRWSGAVRGPFSFSNANQSVTLTPNRPYTSGEAVMVILSHDLKAADGTPLRSAGYSYQFFTRSRPAPVTFTELDTFSNVTSGQTRIYGAAASDLNEDGWMDLTTVNEVSHDLRVFLNMADGSGLYGTVMLPPLPIGVEASPNEPGDFNNDGHADLAIAASDSSDAWFALGVGNGTYMGGTQSVSVGSTPHGVAVLDADGDGDPDVATSNTGANNISLMLNNGSGVFGSAINFDSGGGGEYALSAGDMDNDGIMDLVVGARFDQDVIVMRGNGNGTFTAIETEGAGGSVWMIACGDVNGDGNLDVTCANDGSNNGSILLGSGAGAVALTQVQPTADHVVATDLGDFDGDGDMDWVLSSFGGGEWRLFANDGSGSFSFNQAFEAPSNPSCAIIVDIDNDRDLDLVQSDEIADVIVLQQNGPASNLVRPLGDFNSDGDVDGGDSSALEACYSGDGVDAGLACGHGDFDGDGDVDCADATAFENAWTGGGTAPTISQCGPIGEVPAANEWGVLMAACALLTAATVVAPRILRKARANN